MGIVEILVGVLVVWLAALSYLFFKERSFLRLLFPKVGARDIRNKFQEVIQAVDKFAENEKLLEKKLEDLGKEGLSHIQRVAVVRYNPYNDTGGDQSFSVALLDGHLDGLVITSLHSRAGTRIYTKLINKGKSDLDLSKEESSVLNKVLA